MLRKSNLVLALTIALLAGTSGHALAAGGGGVLADPGAMEGKHFHPKGKMPSKFTIELQNGLRKTLPFEDKRDADEAKKGFIAAPPYKQIMAEAGNVAWDMASYEYLLQGKDFDSVHPSLQRQAILNMAPPHDGGLAERAAEVATVGLALIESKSQRAKNENDLVWMSR